MTVVYGKSYYENYDIGIDKIAYKDNAILLNHFNGVADRIINDFAPKTVLDAGCALGMLVKILRDRGVEAYGIDISEYAINNVDDSIKPYCAVCSLTEALPANFPPKFDLVFSSEVIEHLYEEDAINAIGQLCKYTDTILFSSTPHDITDETHVNVHLDEYWARVFAKNGFYHNVNYNPEYISIYAKCFYKTDNLIRIVEDYERTLRIKNHAINVAKAQEVLAMIYPVNGNDFDESKKIDIWTKGNKISYQCFFDDSVRAFRFDPADNDYCIVKNIKFTQNRVPVDYRVLNGIVLGDFLLFRTKDPQILIDIPEGVSEIEINATIYPIKDDCVLDLIDYFLYGLEQSNVKLEQSRMQLEATTSEFEKRNQHFMDEAKDLEMEAIKLNDELYYTKTKLNSMEEKYNNLDRDYCKTVTQRDHYKREFEAISLSTVWRLSKPLRRVFDRLRNGKPKRGRNISKQYPRLRKPSFEVLETQKRHRFERNIKISILVPLYNTPIKFLRDMIDSVKMQTYVNWELCLADGSDADKEYVENTCRKYLKRDSRIKYKRLDKNEGIAGNTNRCFELASGEFLALLDHDDVLHPSALYEVMKAIELKHADFVYTDEATFEVEPFMPSWIHCKPDFAIDTLRAVNYICHFSAFKRDLFEEVGGMSSEHDGSQDYDLILKLSEKAKDIVHIPQILYFWRSHSGSVASDVSIKPYCITAAEKALNDHYKRLGISANAKLAPDVESMYKTDYEIIGNPLISIIIPNNDHADDLRRCIRSIYSASSYKNYEIIIIENNSKSRETFDLYEELKKHENLSILTWDKPFNYSEINNFGVEYAKGEHLLFLNNDIEVITDNWLEEMLMYAQREDVGAVGAKLLYFDNTIQHAGVIFGMGGVAGHIHKNHDFLSPGYAMRLKHAQNFSAVTAACMMMRKEVFYEVGKLNEGFQIAFNDVDLCMRIRKKGYLIVFTPFAQLYHYESKSRGTEDTFEKQKRFQSEISRFAFIWQKELNDGDPYFNPNFSLDVEDYIIKQELFE